MKTICTAGKNYFQLYPNGDIFRCMHYYGIKQKPIMNVNNFSFDKFLSLDLYCNNSRDCVEICDRDWSVKWEVDDNNNIIKKNSSGHLESRFGIQDKDNIDVSKVKIFWAPTMVCNYNCEYCHCVSSSKKTEEIFPSSSNELSDKEWIDFFINLKNNYEYGIVTTNGGEPFKRLNALTSVIKEVQDKFLFAITTNLSYSIVDFVRKVNPFNVEFNLSLHPSDKNFRFDIFLGRCLLLKRSGFNFKINYVGYPEQLYLYDYYKNIFSKYNIRIELIPFVGCNRDNTVYGYTEEEERYVNSKADLISRKIGKCLEINDKKENLKNLVGVFYYAWYNKDDNWTKKCARFERYGVQPFDGKYNSIDNGVFQSHIQQAEKAGIDFFISSFNGEKSRNELLYLINSLNDSKVKFAIHYETVNIFSDPFKSKKEDILLIKEHFKQISNDFIKSNNYLKIDDKPVVFIYTSRRIVGDLNEIDIIREVVLEETGMECYIIGDEIWWEDEKWIGKEERLKKFDCIYAYNLYTPDKTNNNNKFTGKDYIDFIEPLYKKFYEKAKNLNIGLAPNIMPRYNDESIRQVEGHYPLPSYGTKFFEDYFNMCKKYFLGNTNMLLVTSFNEWYEDTQIELTGASYNDLKDKYDETPQYGSKYLLKVLEFKNILNGKEKGIIQNGIFYKFDSYSTDDVGPIFYLMDNVNDPSLSITKNKNKIFIFYYDREKNSWSENNKIDILCDENFNVTVQSLTKEGIFINGKSLENILDIPDSVFKNINHIELSDPKKRNLEPEITKLKKGE